MDEPEPPDPGGGDPVPAASNFIEIDMDLEVEVGKRTIVEVSDSGTDSSVKRKVKRSRIRKICSNCNKRIRKHGQANDNSKAAGCGCSDDADIEKTLASDSNNTTVKQITSSELPFGPSATSTDSVLPPSPPKVAREKYDLKDIAPYVVHVQRIINSPNDATTLHPVMFGKYLRQHRFSNIVNGSVKRIGRNRVSIAFSHFADANSFLSQASLAENKLKAFIPSYNVTRLGVVRGVPSELTPEEIIEDTSVPSHSGKILKVRRINYKTIVDGAPVWKPTQTIVITFDGQVLPERVFICYNALPVTLYTYPTVQCYKCCRFGHTKVQCRSTPRCYKCGGEHTGDSCEVEEESTSCCLCGGIHFATSKDCPEFDRQKQIKYSMASKCLSYAEASRLIPPLQQSYAEILATPRDQGISLNNSKVKVTIPSPTNSYRKTIYKKPHAVPKITKGYNKIAQQDITCTPTQALPNGCALPEHNQEGILSISDIIALLNTLVLSKITQPDNAAHIIETINILKKHNGSHQIHSSSVELQECSKQKK